MEQFQHRRKARIIAIIDLVLTSMSIWVPIIFFVGAIGLTVMSNDDNKFSKELSDELQKKGMSEEEVAAGAGIFAAIFWVYFVVSTVAVIIQLVAAIKLLNATQIGKDPAAGAKQCRFWRNTTIVFTILGVLGSFRNGAGILVWSWVCVALHILGIYFVQNFITELDGADVGTLPRHQGQVPTSAGMAYAYMPPPGQDTMPPGQDTMPPNYDDAVNEKKPF